MPDAEFRWLTVDLAPIVDLRTRLLPAPSRMSVCAQSALDYSWMDRVDPSGGVFIASEGVLMYLQPGQAMGLITECASKFPNGRMLFDLPPTWVAMLARRGLWTSLRYKSPPMRFSLSVADAAGLVNTVPGIRAVRDLQMPPGRGPVFNTMLSIAYRLRPSLTLLEFG
jgi:O-methyltransferase involved in polyketide biosynthesis